MARRRADDAPLPVSLEAERSILGSLLLGDITMYANQLELLQADDLSLDAHRKIYRAMLDLRDEGVPIDSITLREHLSNKRELETVGGVAYLSSLIDGVIERPSIEHHGRIVRDKALLRRIIHHADAQINRASARGADPVIITREICQFAESLEQDVGGNENWRALFHSFEDFQNAPPLRFAIEEFAQEQAITLIGGLAGHGKTLVMLAMAQAMLEKLPLFDYFWAPRSSGRTLYLVPECAIGPFWTRLKLFRLEDYVRSERLLVRTLSSKEQVSLTDPRILKAAEGADIILDTAVRFMDGSENEVESSRAFAQTLFRLLSAGARTITGAHHAPKASENQERMSLENILRGSSDIGAMIATAWGLRQIDADSNRIFVQNVKARDFQPCGPFIVEARPHLDNTGRFKMLAKPGEAGELRTYLLAHRQGAPETPGKQDKIRQAVEMQSSGKSVREIASTLGVGKSTVSRWLEESDTQVSQYCPTRDSVRDKAEPDGRDGLERESLPVWGSGTVP